MIIRNKNETSDSNHDPYNLLPKKEYYMHKFKFQYKKKPLMHYHVIVFFIVANENLQNLIFF